MLELLRRVRYVVFMMVVAAAVTAVVNVSASALARIDWGHFIFSPMFAVPVFVISFLFLPAVQRLLPFKRW